MIGQFQRQFGGKQRHSGWAQDGGSIKNEAGTSWVLTPTAAATAFIYHLVEASGLESEAQTRRGTPPVLGRWPQLCLEPSLGKHLAPTSKLARLDSSAGWKRGRKKSSSHACPRVQ